MVIRLDDFFDPVDPEEVIKVVEEARRDTRYQVTDYPVELLVSKFRDEPSEEGDIYIPTYQRQLRWDLFRQSYFIESLLLRIPVPPIFLYEVKGRLEVVDGSQRLRTLSAFVKEEFSLTNLEKLDVLNGMTFSSLPPPIQRRFLNTTIRSFVLDEGTEVSTRVEMFRRLNTTSKRLHDAEVRKGAYQGPFLDLILDASESDLFKSLTPRISKNSDPQSERQELVTRFFVYADDYRSFTHDVQKFLDGHVIIGNNKFNEAKLKDLKSEFLTTMEFIKKHYPHAFYRNRSSSVLPRVRFEAVAVGTCLALRSGKPKADQDFSWLWGDELNALVRTDASNSGPRLRARIEYVRDRILSG